MSRSLPACLLVACIAFTASCTHVPPVSLSKPSGNPTNTTALATSPTQLTVTNRVLPMAPLGPLNPWPKFSFQFHHTPLTVSEDLSPEDHAGMLKTTDVPFLPYLMQNNYTRQRKLGALPTLQLENDSLRAVFYPTLGGRMISLYDKRQHRELLFNNPVLQFANLAIRNAWFAGGVEWNGPLYGHSLLSCSPVFASRVETPRGPLLRLYEFDRVLETTWQVELFLPAGDNQLWVHVKAINPNSHDINFYWWSNIAVPQTRETRVLSPADYALSHETTGNGRMTFPVFAGFDGSYPAKYPYAKSIFFRKPGISKPWSVYVDGQGLGLSHVSTRELSGRKFFTWGNGLGNQHWMDYLSEPGRGNYLEIQGGVTPSQLQTRPLKAGASLEWTECLSPFAMNVKAAQDPDYKTACTTANQIIDQQVPEAKLQEMHAFLSAQATVPVQTLLHDGSGWGWLYEKRTGRPISPGLRFKHIMGETEQPWDELLTTGQFSTKSLDTAPCSFNVSDEWITLLSESARHHGATWLHHLHLGVAMLEQGKFEAARKNFTASISLKDNALSQRCLALLNERDGNTNTTTTAYQRAWALGNNDPNLAVEIADFYFRNHRYADFADFKKSLPPQVAGHERIVLQTARIALEEGQYEVVRQLIDREFITVREGEVSLSELWFASYQKEAEQNKGRPLSPEEQQDLMQKFPPPRQIDFRKQ